MGWFSKALKRVTKEIERSVKKVSREVGRVGAQIGTVVGTIPIPGLAAAGQATVALSTVLQGKSGTRAFELIPKATLEGLIRGASIAANPAGALEAMIGTFGKGMEVFTGAKDAGASLTSAIALARQAAGVAKTGYDTAASLAGGIDYGMVGRNLGGLAGSAGGSGWGSLAGGLLSSARSGSIDSQQLAALLGGGGLLASGIRGPIPIVPAVPSRIGGSSPAVQRFIEYHGTLYRR